MAHIVMVSLVGFVAPAGVVSINCLEQDQCLVVCRVQVIDLPANALYESVLLLLHFVRFYVDAACHEVDVVEQLLFAKLG